MYCKFIEINLNLKKNANSFRFGDSKSKSLGNIKIRIPFSSELVFFTDVNVVSANAPFIFSLDRLD